MIMNKDLDRDPASKVPEGSEEEKQERHLERRSDGGQEEEEKRYMRRMRREERNPNSSHWGYKSWPAPDERSEAIEPEKPSATAEADKRELRRNEDDREDHPASTGKSDTGADEP